MFNRATPEKCPDYGKLPLPCLNRLVTTQDLAKFCQYFSIIAIILVKFFKNITTVCWWVSFIFVKFVIRTHILKGKYGENVSCIYQGYIDWVLQSHFPCAQEVSQTSSLFGVAVDRRLRWCGILSQTFIRITTGNHIGRDLLYRRGGYCKTVLLAKPLYGHRFPLSGSHHRKTIA